MNVFRLTQPQKMQARARIAVATLEVSTFVRQLCMDRLFGTSESFRMRYVEDVLLGTLAGALAKVTCDQCVRCAKVQSNPF
jgi:hypothetical protein